MNKYPKVDLSRWSMPFLSARVQECLEYPSVEIVVYAKMRDVETGEPGEVLHRERYPNEMWRNIPPSRHLEMIRQAVLKLVQHEVDECLYVDGVRLTDPHPALRGLK